MMVSIVFKFFFIEVCHCHGLFEEHWQLLITDYGSGIKKNLKNTMFEILNIYILYYIYNGQLLCNCNQD